MSDSDRPGSRPGRPSRPREATRRSSTAAPHRRRPRNAVRRAPDRARAPRRIPGAVAARDDASATPVDPADALIAAAVRARQFAHARYSHFEVGAALETAEGRSDHRLQHRERDLRPDALRRARRARQGPLGRPRRLHPRRGRGRHRRPHPAVRPLPPAAVGSTAATSRSCSPTSPAPPPATACRPCFRCRSMRGCWGDSCRDQGSGIRLAVPAHSVRPQPSRRTLEQGTSNLETLNLEPLNPLNLLDPRSPIPDPVPYNRNLCFRQSTGRATRSS